jgi:Glycosyl transferase family 11
MILLLTIGGRTGNQLFQIAYALSQRKKREWLISVGFGKTMALLAGDCRKRWFNVDAAIPRYLIERIVFPVIHRTLIRTGIVTFDWESDEKHLIWRGKIRSFRVLKGYFQSTDDMSPDIRTCMHLKSSLRRKAREILGPVCNGRIPVFVHLRRSDFDEVAVGGQSVKLPDQYYVSSLKRLRTPEEGLCYVIVGDDPGHATRLFQTLSPKFISHLSITEDLALMSICDGGVLSNSTFAWWGAFFGNSRLGYVAPKYWWGWRVGEWIPPRLRGSFVTDFVEVEKD